MLISMKDYFSTWEDIKYVYIWNKTEKITKDDKTLVVPMKTKKVVPTVSYLYEYSIKHPNKVI